jgi:predicted Zn-dependent protease
MEGVGVAACAERVRTEWILVKAICDWADGAKTDNHQAFAAASAVSFVKHVVTRVRVTPASSQLSDSSADARTERPSVVPVTVRRPITRARVAAFFGSGGLLIAGVFFFLGYSRHLPMQTTSGVSAANEIRVRESDEVGNIEFAAAELAKKEHNLFENYAPRIKMFDVQAPPRTEPFATYRERVKSLRLRGTAFFQPIHDKDQPFTEKQGKIYREIPEFFKAFFNVDLTPPRGPNPLTIPLPATVRQGASTGQTVRAEQYDVGDIFTELDNTYPKEVYFAVLACTTRDIGRDGYSFRLADSQTRYIGSLAVFSYARLKDPDSDYSECQIRIYQLAAYCFMRTLQIEPCWAYRCGMNAAVNFDDFNDGKLRFDFCPECLQKLCWVCQIDPLDRYDRLVRFAEVHDLKKQRDGWAKAREILARAFARR